MFDCFSFQIGASESPNIAGEKLLDERFVSTITVTQGSLLYPYSFDIKVIIKIRHFNFTIQIHIQLYDKMPRKAHIS